MLNDFSKDSKIASKSFSLKDPRWKGTKKDSNNDVVSWFPDFTSDQEKSPTIKTTNHKSILYSFSGKYEKSTSL